jgi:hypothetical protein
MKKKNENKYRITEKTKDGKRWKNNTEKKERGKVIDIWLYSPNKTNENLCHVSRYAH